MSITPEEPQETNNVVAQFYLDFRVCDLPRLLNRISAQVFPRCYQYCHSVLFRKTFFWGASQLLPPQSPGCGFQRAKATHIKRLDKVGTPWWNVPKLDIQLSGKGFNGISPM